MTEEVRRHSESFLSGTVRSDGFIRACRELYQRICACPENMTGLEAILVTPFVHEFAYWQGGEQELAAQVEFFLSVLHGRCSYRYSAFVQIPPPGERNQAESYLYQHFENVELTALRSVFLRPVERPVNLKDILTNLLVDMLAGMDPEQPEESGFDYVNCGEDMPFSPLWERVRRLLSYYLGLEACFVQICICPGNPAVYTIL